MDTFSIQPMRLSSASDHPAMRALSTCKNPLEMAQIDDDKGPTVKAPDL